MVPAHERKYALLRFAQLASQLRIKNAVGYEQARNFLHTLKTASLFASDYDATSLDSAAMIVEQKMREYEDVPLDLSTTRGSV